MSFRGPAFAAAALLLSLSGFGCDAILGPSPQPTNCWIGVVGQYRFDTTADDPTAAAEDAGRIIIARLQRIGLADYAVLARSDGTIEVDLPTTGDPDAIRELIKPTGEVAFVPIPDGDLIATGDPIPVDLPVLFGRDGLATVRLGTSIAGQRSLEIELTPAASQLFADYSTAHTGSQFALVVDGVVLLAPSVMAPILDGKIAIGGPDNVESNRLVALLALPPLPGTLTELSFGPFAPPDTCAGTE